MEKLKIPNLFIIFLILLFIPILSCKQPPQGPANKGEIAPDFTLPALNGDKIRLSDFKSKVVLIEFWATWCPPCKDAIPHLNSLQEKYLDKGLVVMGITIDENEYIANIRNFVEEKGIRYKILFSDSLTSKLYNVNTIPTIYLLDKDQKIVNRYLGYYPGMEEKISKNIEKLL